MLSERHELTTLVVGQPRVHDRDRLSRVERTKRSFAHAADLAQAALARVVGPFDVVFGQASFGFMHDLRGRCGRAAVVAHVELAGLEYAMARREFPLLDVEAHDTRSALTHEALRRSDLVITPSLYSRSLLPPDIRGRTVACMEGFDTRTVDRDELASLRRDLGIPPQAPVAGFFGRTIEAVRGFDVFVAAAKRLRQRYPGLVLLVVGATQTAYGNEAAYLEDETYTDYVLRGAAMSRSDVLFMGTQPRAAYLRMMALADVAMFPLFEGAGVWSLFECMSVGTAVVATRGAFVPEVVRDGRDGLLCARGDANGFVQAATALLADSSLRARVGSAAKLRIQTAFSVSAAASCYEHAFTRALGRDETA